VLALGLGLSTATAQTLTALHAFERLYVTAGVYTNREGANPASGVVVAGNTFYGTTTKGGPGANGSIFAMNLDGTGFKNLHSFGAGTYTNLDGFQIGRVILSGDTLYGVATKGGTMNAGALFKINTNGTGFTVFHYFNSTYQDPGGMYPEDGFAISGSTLYGVAQTGAANGYGNVFAIKTDGTGFTNLHSFKYNEGSSPSAGLILVSNVLYGTAASGGLGAGSVFKMRTDGSGFTNLHSFNALNEPHYPYCTLCVVGNTLYGTTSSSTAASSGAVFRINMDGSGYKIVHLFSPTSGWGTRTNYDGAIPAALAVVGQTIYGTTQYGGTNDTGTLFKVNADGAGFATLYHFPPYGSSIYTNTAGTLPLGPLTVVSNTLYGVTSNDGAEGRGTVFSFLIPATPPQLSVLASQSGLVLAWPTNATGFSVQSAPNLLSAGAWTNVPVSPAVVGGSYVVTNPVSGAPQKYYRLKQ